MKIKWICFVMVSLLVSGSTRISFGQPPDTLWTRTFGGEGYDSGKSVIETSDGGFILFGDTRLSGGCGNFWLIKTDNEGNEIWNKTFGGNEYDLGVTVIETSDNGLILQGNTESYGAGFTDFWLIKTDSEGNEIWNRTYGGKLDDLCKSVEETSDGGYILLGYTDSYGAGFSDFWLIKTDSEGNEIWNRTYGGELDDRGNSVKETLDGGFILAGSTESYGAGCTDICLVKTDSEGNEVWAKTYGGSNYDYCESVVQTSDGGFVFFGDTGSYGAGCNDFWLIKTDNNGTEMWKKTFGGKGFENASSMEKTSDGGFILIGDTNSFGLESYDLWLIKTDSNGNEIWDKTIGGSDSDFGNSVAETSDGGYILLGYTESYGAGKYDFWLIDLNYYPPSLFSLLSPADEDTIVSRPIQFDWEDSFDPYSGAIKYDLYIDTDAGFSNPIVVSGIEESFYSYPEELLNAETYYWKVCAGSEEGKTTWSDETRSFLTNYEEYRWELSNAEASDGNFCLEGIDNDDYVQITFDRPTDKPEIDASNIDDILRLSGGHTWLDGAGGMKEAVWNEEGDKVFIYLSTDFSLPTVAPGDTVTPDYYRMSETPCVITGSFDPSSVRKKDVPAGVPSELILYPNKPNPFNPVTTITVGIPADGRVIVSIYDLRGRLVKRLYDGVKSAGTTSFIWNAQDQTSGVYLCRVEMPDSGWNRNMKMMLLK